MVWAEIEAEENLDGLSPEQLETFRRRAVPEPGAMLREGAELTNDARRDIPSTIIATAFPSAEYQRYAREKDWALLAGIPELRNVTWVDLPTSHWPMWSRPKDLAAIIAEGGETVTVRSHLATARRPAPSRRSPSRSPADAPPLRHRGTATAADRRPPTRGWRQCVR